MIVRQYVVTLRRMRAYGIPGHRIVLESDEEGVVADAITIYTDDPAEEFVIGSRHTVTITPAPAPALAAAAPDATSPD